MGLFLEIFRRKFFLSLSQILKGVILPVLSEGVYDFAFIPELSRFATLLLGDRLKLVTAVSTLGFISPCLFLIC